MKNKFKTIDDVICEYLDKNNRRTEVARGNSYWSASSLGHCKRYQTLCRAGAQSNGEKNYSWANAAEDGHMGHAWRQHALSAVGVLVDMEKAIIDEKLCYRGHYDAVVMLNGKLILADIKTQNQRAFRYRNRLPRRIDPNHERQLGSYFYFLKRDKYPDLYSARLYYINKNNGEREEFELFFDNTFLKSIIEELNILNDHWTKGLLPKKEIGNFCRICRYEPLCRSLFNKKDTTITHAVQRSLSNTIKPEDKNL